MKKDLSGLRVLENPHNLPYSTFLGVLGMPGTIMFIYGLGVDLLWSAEHLSYRKDLLFRLE